MKPWKRVEPTETVKIGWKTIVTKNFIDPVDGRVRPFTTIFAEGDKAAAVIALTADNKVVVARQFRPGPERIMDELPGGGVERGEDPKVAAERELLEETGYKPQKMELLGTNCRDAYSNATWHYYLATGCELIDAQNLDEGEQVDVHLISIEQLIDNAMHDRMTDPIAVLYAYEKLKALAEGKTE